MTLDEAFAQLITRMVDRAIAERLGNLASEEHPFTGTRGLDLQISDSAKEVRAVRAQVHIPQSGPIESQTSFGRDFHTVSEVRCLIENNLKTLVRQLGIAPFTPKTLAQRLERITELRIKDLTPTAYNYNFFTGTVMEAVKLRDWRACPVIHLPPRNSGTYTFSPELLKKYTSGLSLIALSEPPKECKISIVKMGYHSTKALKSLLLHLLPHLRSLYGQDEITIAAIALIAAKNTRVTSLDNVQGGSRRKCITRFHARIGTLVADKFWVENPFYKVRWGVYKLKSEELEHGLQQAEGESAVTLSHSVDRIPENSYYIRHSPNDIRRLVKTNMKYIVKHMGCKPFLISDFISLLAFYAELTPADREPVHSSGGKSRFYVTAYSCLIQKSWSETPIVQLSHGLYRLRPEILDRYKVNQLCSE